MATENRLPYPGLRAFTREESDLFFGRETCVDTMVDRLAATRFLAVLGPSGSGKSSLVRTGLLDALDLGFHPWAGSRWQVADLHPGGQPLCNLAVALLEAKGSAFEQIDVDLLMRFLGHGPRSLAEWVSGGNLLEESNLLILVDQFEELFRYNEYAQREEAEAFVIQLLESASAPGVPIHVVITMRSEYLGACTLVPGLAERINAGLYLTPRMGRDECREAIEGPAGVMGFKVAPSLANRLLNDLATFAPWGGGEAAKQMEQLSRRADQLPLMQHVLNRLWDRAVEGTSGASIELGFADYEQVGGLSGALDAHGADVIAELGPDRTRRIESVFRALVSGPSVALAVRRPCRLGELIDATEGARDDVEAIVKAFSAPDCNFLRVSEPSLTDDVIVDISHESLIRQWGPLTTWLEKETRDATKWHQLIDAENRHAQGEGGLVTGLDLHNLRAWWESAGLTSAWASRHGGSFDAARAFLEVSCRAETALADEQNRRETRERRLLHIVVTSLAAALVAGGIAVFGWQRGEAQSKKNARANLKLTADFISRISDDYVNTIGAPQQAEFMEGLVETQTRLDELYANFLDLEGVALIVRSRLRLANAWSHIGEAERAMKNYEMAYRRGLESLSGRERPPESLLASLLDAGSTYAWHLFDTGKIEEAEKVRVDMKQLAIDHTGPITPELRLAYGGIENLESRYYYDLKKMSDNSEQREVYSKRSDDHLVEAIQLVNDMAYARNATMEAMSFQITLYDNVGDDPDLARRVQETAGSSYDQNIMKPDASQVDLAVSSSENLEDSASDPTMGENGQAQVQEGSGPALPDLHLADSDPEGRAARKERFTTQICSLADRMEVKNPLDKRAIGARVSCFRGMALDARDLGNIEEVEGHYQDAANHVKKYLDLVPADQRLLLEQADIESDLVSISWDPGMETKRKQHNKRAIYALVKALKGRTLLQSNSSQVKSLYEYLDRSSFSDADEATDFYEKIFDALEKNIEAFPDAPSFSYVAGSAALNWSTLVLSKDPTRSQEAEEKILRAIGFFGKARVMDNISSYTEDFAISCGAYARLVEIFAASERVEDMLANIKTMNRVCTPVLDEYPWDFYLRQHFIANAKRAGALLFKLERYAEAVPFLEYSSRWGNRESAKLLSLAYREGLGVEPDENQAKSLEESKNTKRFTLSANFRGVLAPFYVYTLELPKDCQLAQIYTTEASEWPQNCPAQGIDDQLEWLKEARKGTVAPEVREAFRDLHKIARDNGMSFPNLCVYAFGVAATPYKFIDGYRFEMADAILLMDTGTYESIRGLLNTHEALASRVNNIGRELLKHSVKPDIAMVQKLWRIVNEYQKQQQSQQSEAREAKSEDQ